MEGKSAQIDLDQMARLVRGLEDVAQYLPGIRNEFVKTMHRFTLNPETTAPLIGVAGWARDVLPDVRRRLALARHIEASTPGWTSGSVTIDEAMICTLAADKAQRFGAETARALLEGPGVPDAALLARLEELDEDPYFAAGFASALTPEELAAVVTRLSNVRPVFDGRNGQTYEEYLASTAWYGAALSSMSRTLATATFNVGELAVPDDYAKTWVAAITAEPFSGPSGDAAGTARPSQAAALGLLLGSGGRFEDGFLGEVADGVYTYERAYADEHGGAVWRPRTTTGQPGQGIYDPVTDGWYVDPMVGVLSALSLSPEAAQGFFTRGGTTTVDVDGVDVTVGERLQYLVVDRTWAAHRSPGNALGAALEAATTKLRDQGSHGEMSATIAGQTFALIGDQTGKGAEGWRGDQGWQMHEGLRVHVSQMLASYGADVFRVSTDHDGDDLSAGVQGLGSGVLFSSDMPYGVRLSRGHLAAIVETLGERPEDFEPLLVGLFQANNLAIATGLKRASDEYGIADAAARFWGNQRDLFSPAFTSAGEATSWILQAGRGGAEADEAARKTQAELVADALSTVLDMPFVPDIKGEWLKHGYGETKGWALDQIKDVSTDAKGRYSQADEAARVRLEQSVMDLLLRAGYLSKEGQGQGAFAGGLPDPDGIHNGPDGQPVGFDFSSEEYQAWYVNSPVRSILTESVINTYASAYGSVS